MPQLRNFLDSLSAIIILGLVGQAFIDQGYSLSDDRALIYACAAIFAASLASVSDYVTTTVKYRHPVTRFFAHFFGAFFTFIYGFLLIRFFFPQIIDTGNVTAYTFFFIVIFACLTRCCVSVLKKSLIDTWQGNF